MRNCFFRFFQTFLFYSLMSATGTTIVSAAETAEELYALAQQSLDEEDAMTAMSYLRQAAEQGHAPSQARLAWLLDGAELNEEAVSLYRLAADNGNAEGQYGLATMYSKGEGVERDSDKFLELVRLSAGQSYGPAMSAMSNIYEQGLHGQPQDATKAMQWVQRGVELHQVWALARMEKAYRFGELGLSVDPDQAEQYAQKRRQATAD